MGRHLTHAGTGEGHGQVNGTPQPQVSHRGAPLEACGHTLVLGTPGNGRTREDGGIKRNS